MRAAVAAAALLLVTPATPWAHEIPARVSVQAFVEQVGQVVRVLVRVPMNAMRDVEFPTRGPGYLDLTRADSTLRDAAKLWVADAITLSADDAVLPSGRIVAVRAAVPSDRAFDRYQDALAQVQGPPLNAATDIVVPQAMMDVLLEYPVASANARLAIQARFARLGVRTATSVRVIFPDGRERAYVYTGDAGTLQLDPSWWHAASRFVTMGASHLLEGIDHLLFLLCLILPVRRFRPLVGIVTAFTVAHSMTLGAAAMGYAPDALWFPPLVEFLIAGSIVYMAIENALGAKLERRWMMAFGFGLVHGFGFSYALRDSLQFAGGHLLTALAAFNIGIELGQLLVLAVSVPVLTWFFTRVADTPGRLVISAVVAHTAWHWMTERFDVLQTYRLTWPAMDATLAVGIVRLVMAVLVVGGAAWALSGMMARLTSARPRGSTLLLALGLGTSLFGVGMIASPAAAQDTVRSTMLGVYTAEQAVKGKEVFNGACSGCHTSASYSGAEFKTRWMGKLLWEFYAYVSKLMPDEAPGALSEAEYVNVTAYVLKLNGMPAGEKELTADSTQLKAMRLDTLPPGFQTGASGGSGSGGARRLGAHIR